MSLVFSFNGSGAYRRESPYSRGTVCVSPSLFSRDGGARENVTSEKFERSDDSVANRVTRSTRFRGNLGILNEKRVLSLCLSFPRRDVTTRNFTSNLREHGCERKNFERRSRPFERPPGRRRMGGGGGNRKRI